MTAIEAGGSTNGDAFEFADLLDRGRSARVTPGTAGVRTPGYPRDPRRERVLLLAQRLVALESGNDSQRQLVQLLHRGIDLAESVGRPRTENDTDEADDTAGDVAGGSDTPGEYRIALEGVDAVESFESAVNAVKARLITEAYVRAREELVDPALSPGQRILHGDGGIDRTLSAEQIAGADLAVIVNLPPGLARLRVSEARRLVQNMPHTLARLHAGEFSGYQQRLIVEATAHYRPVLAERFDEMVCAAPFPGRHAGAGQHRVSTRALTRRLRSAAQRIGLEPPQHGRRRAGFAGRFVRFGLTGGDGMTRLHGSVPAVHASAITTLLDDLARTAPVGDPRTLDQRRADAFMTCFTGPAALSPAAQLELELSAPSFDEHGHYSVVELPQNVQAAATWQTIRLLAAGLGLTFPDVPRAIVNVDVCLETLTGTPHPMPCRASPRLPGAAGEDRPPPADVARPPSRPAQPASGPHAVMAALHTQAADASPGLSTGHETYCGCGCDVLAEASPDGAAARHRAASVRGVGEIPDCLAQRLIRFADLRRILTDPLTGQPLEVTRRRPNALLREAVLNRDRHCRFPGCTRTTVADLDHIEPYRHDAPTRLRTAPQNLQALCREHHRVKHQLHWHPDMQPDGTIQWRNNLLDLTATT